MPQDTPLSRRAIWTIFFAALAIRWIYAITLYALYGSDGLTGVDSESYLAVAQQFSAAIHAGAVHGWQWLGPNPAVMPLFTWLLGINGFFGTLLPINYVLMQGLFDAGTCVMVFLLARDVHPRIAMPAAIAATINPTQIVLSGIVYPDTPFVFFVAVLFVATLRWIRAPAMRWAMLAGLALGAATLIRILIIPWMAVLIVLLMIVCAVSRRLTIAHLSQLAVIGTLASLLVAPVVMRNVSSYGEWALTSQSGYHFAGWLVPLVKEARDHTPWQKNFDEMESRKRARFGPPDRNPFEESRRYVAIGHEEFSKFDVSTLLKAWTLGAVINLASPAIILSPPILKLPRTGFYGTVGDSSFEKISNFLFHSENALYTWVLLSGIAGLTAVRLIQFLGILDMILAGHNWPILLLFAGWIGFILLVNGPLASPKYRLPMEPILAVLTGAGIYGARRRRTLDRDLKIQAAPPLLNI